MPSNKPEFWVELYETSNGQCPVGKFLQELSKIGEANAIMNLICLRSTALNVASPG